MNIVELTVHELQEKIKNKELTIKEINEAYIKQLKEKEPEVQAFITDLTESAMEQANNIQTKLDNGEKLGDLAGIPIGIKDNICTKNIKTTCASKMLENFVAPYDATVMEKINSEKLITLGLDNKLITSKETDYKGGIFVITSALSKAWDTIKTVTKPGVDFVKDIVSSAWNFISTTTSTIWNSIKGILQSVWDLIKALIDLKVAAVKLVITTAWNAIKTVTTTTWNVIKSVIQTVLNAIKPIVSTGVNAIKSTVTTVFNAIKSIVTTVWNGIKSVISTVWNSIKSVVSTGANAVRSVVSSVFSKLTNIMTAPFKTAQSVISGILGGITSAINRVTSAIKKVTSMGKMIENPNVNNEQNAINPNNEADYTKVRFNYSKAKQTTVSDVMATNYSILESLKDFSKGIKTNNSQAKVNTESNISLNLHIDKFVNERKQDVKELMQEMTFEIKRQRLGFGGVR